MSDNPFDFVLVALEVSIDILDDSLAFGLDVFAEVINMHFFDPAASISLSSPQWPSGQL